jgi:putative ABC transport system ATP-binding protein
VKIKTTELTKSYRVGASVIHAVNRVNLEIDELSFIALVGPSGSGKSTLLNLIGLNDYPTSGGLFLDGVDASALSSMDRRKTRRLRLGFVFQTFNLLPTLSALENVEVPMSLAGKPQKTQRERAMTLLRTVGLGSRCRHRPGQLSMGEMQRVAIARALANEPEMILADEPTGELDSKTAEEIIKLLFEVNRKEKTSVIVATHDEKVVEIADLTYTIKDGALKPGN